MENSVHVLIIEKLFNGVRTAPYPTTCISESKEKLEKFLNDSFMKTLLKLLSDNEVDIKQMEFRGDSAFILYKRDGRLIEEFTVKYIEVGDTLGVCKRKNI